MRQPRRRRGVGRRSLSALLGAGVIGLTGALTPLPVSASSAVTVFVAYADTARADAQNFPTPWDGSPNTTFEGCTAQPPCTFDAGAVRIVNDSAGPVTVNSVAIRLDTCTYTGWPAAQLQSGADLIVTQLSNGVASGCTGPVPATLDLSDVGPGGSSYAGVCTPDGLQAQVDVTVDGVTTSYVDSGQVLNTGGLDGGVCSGNESIQWTLIGSKPCPGSSLTLAPPSQSHGVLTQAAVTATFANSCGQPLSDTLVRFAVIAGPNTGLSGTGVTDRNGRALFTYSSAHLGTDTLQASVTNVAGRIDSNLVTVIWTVAFAGGGSFVIGDLENTPGSHVLWWGAQWWKVDRLSRGPAPASFKGFESSDPTPACGQTWTTRPGNSPHPPAAVAGLMAVIVTDHVVKSGSRISGTIVHIVVVRTDPGYRPNPGHAGTGTIIAQLC